MVCPLPESAWLKGASTSGHSSEGRNFPFHLCVSRSMKLRVITFSLLAVPALVPLLAQSPVPHLSAQQWREDLHYLAQEMPKQHKSLFHTMTQAQFERAVRTLDADIPRLNDDEIVVRLAQIGTMVNDGHSGLELLDVPGN